MKKFFVFLFLCSVVLSSAFAQDDIFFRNPGDSKVFHSNGLPFKSETKQGSDGLVPKTELMVGDAVQTLNRNADIKIENFNIELKKNSLMSIQSVTDSKIIVYLLDGSLNAYSPSKTSLDTKEFVIITPVSRFSATLPFDVDVSSVSTTESIHVNKGSVLAHNFLTKENVTLQETESVDFLKSRNKIVSVDSTRLSEESAYDKLGIKPSQSTQQQNIQPTSTSSQENNPDSKRVLSIRLTVGKDGAYISPYSGRMLNVPKNENVNYADQDRDDDSTPSVTVEPATKVPPKPTFVSSNQNPKKSEEKPVNQNIEWKKPKEDEPKQTKQEQPVEKKEPIKPNQDNLNNQKDTTKPEQAKKQEPKKQEQPKPEKKSEPARKSPIKSRPFGMGVDLGISSMFDWDAVQGGSAPKLRLNANPYIRSSNVDIKLNLILDYEQNTTGVFSFQLPQLDFLNNNSLVGIQKLITPLSQFVDDIVLGNWFYISRNHDLPIEYNSANLNKFSFIDNEYRTYSYSNTGTKTYTEKTVSKKLPLLLNINTKHLLIRAFTQDIENLSKFNPNEPNAWKRDDSSVTAIDLGFDTRYFGMVVGAIHTAGAYDAGSNSATDKILATARVNLNLSENVNLAINGYIPLFDFVTTYNAGSSSGAIANILGDFPSRFAAGASFNVVMPKMIFNVGADFNLGQLYTGIINRRSVFAENTTQNMYVYGIDNTFAVYPYMNIDFDLGAFALNVNADIPVFLGGSGFAMEHMKSWADMDFLYRVNGGATLKFNFANVMQLSAKLTVDNMFPLRAASVSSKTFMDYARENFSIFNFIPKLSFQIEDGPIFLRISAEQRNIDDNGAFVAKFNPGFTFESRVSLGTDYLLNPNYIRNRRIEEDRKENDFNLIFNTDIGFYSSRYSRTSDTDYTAFSITPHVGVKHKYFTVVAKFEIENFKLPDIFSSPIDIGNVVTSLIDEVNVLNIVKINETKAINAKKRSVFASDQYIKTLKTNAGLPALVDVTISDTASFINGFLNNANATYADISIGWMGKQRFFLNNIVQAQWDATGIVVEDLVSANIDLTIGKFYFGLDVGTTLSFTMDDTGPQFVHGFSGGFENWVYVADIGIGYSTPSLSFKGRFGLQNGELYYNMYDYLTISQNGTFTNYYQVVSPSDPTIAITSLTQFADVDLSIKLSKTLSLQAEYYLPMALFGNSTTTDKLLRDRLSARLTFNTPIFDVYAVAQKRGFMFAPTSGWFNDNDNFALKGGLEFKADYATFKSEIESAHFIYKPGTANVNKGFSINVEVKFGLY